MHHLVPLRDDVVGTALYPTTARAYERQELYLCNIL